MVQRIGYFLTAFSLLIAPAWAQDQGVFLKSCLEKPTQGCIKVMQAEIQQAEAWKLNLAQFADGLAECQKQAAEAKAPKAETEQTPKTDTPQ